MATKKKGFFFGLGRRKKDPGTDKANQAKDKNGADPGKAPVNADLTFAPGDRIAGSLVVEQVLEGSLGPVYLGQDPRQGVSFAVKQPAKWLFQDEALLAAFRLAAASWSDLGVHPRLAYCYFVREVEGQPLVFVEKMEGQPLTRKLAKGQTGDFKSGLALGLEVALALAVGHKRGILHGGLHPGNVFLPPKGPAKLSDFGLAGILPPGHKKQPESSLAYMAPEAHNEHRKKSEEVPKGLGPESDVFSLGVILWEIFLGTRPYEKTKKAAKKPPPDPARLRPEMPDGLPAILAACVSAQREKRPPDAARVAKDLAKCYHKLTGAACPTLSIPTVNTSADELCNRGYARFGEGKRTEAQDLFRRALAVDPFHPFATYNLGILEFSQGKIDDVTLLKRLTECAQKPRNRGLTDELMACVHALRGDPDEAKKALRVLAGRYETLFGGREINRKGVFHTMEGHDKAVKAVAMTSDGRFAISGSADGSVRHWRVATGECLAEMHGHDGSMNSIAISANSRVAISGGDDRALLVYNLSRGMQSESLKGHDHYLNSVALSADGRFAFTGAADMTVQTWDLDRRQSTNRFIDHSGRVIWVDMTPDGHFACSISVDNTLMYWGLGGGKLVSTIRGHKGALSTAAITGGGKRAFCGDSQGWLHMWDLRGKKCLADRLGHQGPVTCVAVTASGRYGLSAGKEGVRLWKLDTMTCLRTITELSGNVNSLDMSADGKYAVCSGPGALVTILEIDWRQSFRPPLFLARLQSYELKVLEKNIQHQKISQATMLADRGHYKQAHDLLHFSWKQEGYGDNDEVMAALAKMAQKGRFQKLVHKGAIVTMKGHRERVKSVAVCAAKKWALSASYDRTLKRWDLDTGKCTATLRGHRDGVSSVAVTSDGKYALSGGLDRTLRLWKPETGQLVHVMGEHRYPVTCAAFANDGRHVLAGSEKAVDIWDAVSAAHVRTLEGERVFSLALSAGGKHGIWRAPGNTVGFWDMVKNRMVRTLDGHKDDIMCLAISSAGRFGVSGDASGIICYWHLPTGKQLAAFTSHRAAITGLALSPCGTLLFSADENSLIKVWDLVKGKYVMDLESADEDIAAMAMGTMARFLVTGTSKGQVNARRFAWELAFPGPKDPKDQFRRV